MVLFCFILFYFFLCFFGLGGGGVDMVNLMYSCCPILNKCLMYPMDFYHSN